MPPSSPSHWSYRKLRSPRMIDPQKSIYATGRRKHAVARVWMQPGNGKIQINERTLE
ncbi:MAG TPA: 30S ribosomal protein S9, partial [Polyangia bacterium]